MKFICWENGVLHTSSVSDDVDEDDDREAGLDLDSEDELDSTVIISAGV